jgi:hypothetical protein
MMTQSMTQPKQTILLSLSDLKPCDLGEDIDGSGNGAEDEVENEDGDMFCHNPQCVSSISGKRVECVHIYDFSESERVMICGPCYSEGYRFCLVTREVQHLKTLKSVLSELFVHEAYHSQLSDEYLAHVGDLHQHFQSMGIDNPSPTHRVVSI